MEKVLKRTLDLLFVLDKLTKNYTLYISGQNPPGAKE